MFLVLISLFQAHLEDLAEKDATQKSDAAREAFLAELALDSKKSAIGGSDNSRHNHDKTKEKKKGKEYRKMKDSKVSTMCLTLASYTGLVASLCLNPGYDVNIFLLFQGTGGSEQHVLHHVTTEQEYVSLLHSRCKLTLLTHSF